MKRKKKWFSIFFFGKQKNFLFFPLALSLYHLIKTKQQKKLPKKLKEKKKQKNSIKLKWWQIFWINFILWWHIAYKQK